MNVFQGIIDIYDENDIEFKDAWGHGVRAVLHQASRGLYRKDSLYAHRKEIAFGMGFLWAGYHLISAENIAEQLKFFLAMEDGTDPRVAMAIDWEKTAKGTATSDQVREFVERYNAAMKERGYPDRYPMLYGGNLVREDKGIIKGDKLLAKCPLWYVFMRSNPLTSSKFPFPVSTWPTYTLWQYDSEARTNGGPPKKVLPGSDWNQYQGTEAELRAAWPFSGIVGGGMLPVHPLTEEMVASVESPVAGFAGRAASIALQEWDFWGKQTYDLHNHATHIGHKEAQKGWYERVGLYWKDGANIHGLDGTDRDSPWSAAFISWVMKTAGANARFRYSSQHSVYVAQAIRDFTNKNEAAGYWGLRLNEVKPAIGDIVCWSREAGVSYKNTHGGQYEGHCDLVVSVGENEIEVIGGNVGDSVTRRPLALEQGFVAPLKHGSEYLFAIMKNRIEVV